MLQAGDRECRCSSTCWLGSDGLPSSAVPLDGLLERAHMTTLQPVGCCVRCRGVMPERGPTDGAWCVMECCGGHLFLSSEPHCGGEDGCIDEREWVLFGFPLHPRP